MDTLGKIYKTSIENKLLIEDSFDKMLPFLFLNYFPNLSTVQHDTVLLMLYVSNNISRISNC